MVLESLDIHRISGPVEIDLTLLVWIVDKGVLSGCQVGKPFILGLVEG